MTNRIIAGFIVAVSVYGCQPSYRDGVADRSFGIPDIGIISILQRLING